MGKLVRMLLAGLACAGATACQDALNVENKNNADEDRALARPSDVEALIAGSFNTMHRATLGASTLAPQMYTLGMENYSSLSNFNMSSRAQIPRPPIANGRGNQVATEYYAPFLGLHRAARAAALGLSRVKQASFVFYPPSANQTARAKAMANFVIGVSLGYGTGLLAVSYRNEFLHFLRRVTGFELFPESIYQFANLPALIVGPDIAIICGVSFAICLFGGVIPAWTASRLKPVEALRYE